jgi:8-oxo-dGTP pyrophosphatase MutT (NUDIX family)
MLKTRQSLIAAIQFYPVVFAGEEKTKKDFLELLGHPNSFQRNHLPGHITGSAWIVNKNLTRTVLIHHAKLLRWLQPGGHADGDEDVLRVAIREAEEETGLTKFSIPDPSIFDLDIHPIPDRADFPAHLHYDVRFLLIADEADSLTISDESTGLKWVDLNSVDGLTNHNPSMMRLVHKTFNLQK